jgi:uncharacterized protein
MIMDTRFATHNIHLEDPKSFLNEDPQLRRLKKQTYIYHSPIIEQIPLNIPGIYTLSGGRQVGKTTLLKQWMAKLLSENISPESIAFFTGELIDDSHALLQLMRIQLSLMPSNSMRYLLLDEVTYIHNWDKAIKFAADSGLLEQTILILTGSEVTVIKEARMRFPGRRGKAKQVDFHLYPLSLREVVVMKKIIKEPLDVILQLTNPPIKVINKLFDEFQNYLKHGGYLTAINELAASASISEATLTIYSDWLRGDMLKRGKQEHYLREILSAIIKRYGSQITWNALAKDLSIDHHKTVSEYCALLEAMDALFIQSALLEDKLAAAPKKAKKIIFTDPFIFHAIRFWLQPVENPYQAQICSAVNDARLSSNLVEACVISHFRRFYPTYYIKAEGEVDIAYIAKNHFWPIEVKWTNQLREKNLKQLKKYPNARIFAKTKQYGKIDKIKVEPLSLALMREQPET